MRAKVIGVWGPVHRQGAISTTAALIASYKSVGGSNKTLLISTEDGTYGNACLYIDSGSVIGSIMEKENNTLDTRKVNNLELLSSNVRFLEDTINKLRVSYDYIIIDLQAGSNIDEIEHNIDGVIVCLPQDKHILKSWDDRSEGIYNLTIDRKPKVYVSSIHYEHDKLNYEKINEHINEQAHYICFSSKIHDAVSDQNVLGFISDSVKNNKIQDEIMEITAICEGIEKKIAISEERKQTKKVEIASEDKLFGIDLYNETE